MSDNIKGIEAILNGISTLIDQKLNNASFDKTLTGLITATDLETNTYTVKINGYEYTDIQSLAKYSVNDVVVLMCPQNQMSKMFIYGKIDTTDYTE